MLSYDICLSLIYPTWYDNLQIHPCCNKMTISCSNPTHGCISGESHNLKRYLHPNVHHSSLCNSQGKFPLLASVLTTLFLLIE